VAAATLNATADQTFTTSPAGTDSYTHMITLAVANLAAVKAGGTGDGHLDDHRLAHPYVRCELHRGLNRWCRGCPRRA
jgi:hypothetical protein